MPHGLVRKALVCILPTVVALGVLARLMSDPLDLGYGYLLKVLAVFVAGAAVVLAGLPRHHPFDSFGVANAVTTARAAVVALLAGLIGERTNGAAAALAVAAAVLVTVLDGVDGWLARRTRMASPFGARFDMETDAVMILVLAVLAWQFGKVGAWVVASGVFRYAFVAAGLVWPSLRMPLPQGGGHRPGGGADRGAVPVRPGRGGGGAGRGGPVCAVAVVPAGRALAAATDGVFPRRRGVPVTTALQWRYRSRQFVSAVLALVVLNAAVTFHNVWPTLGVHWPGEISVELAVLVLCLALTNAWAGATPAALLVLLAAITVLFALGRYADVTVPALYGREINLYWDAPQFAAVIAMLVRVASPWVVAALLAGSLLALVLLYLVARWSLTQIDDVLRIYSAVRWVLGLVAVALVGCFVVQQRSLAPVRLPRFSIPVSTTYAAQVRRLLAAVSGTAGRDLPPSPPLPPGLGGLAGSDVLLVFMESYGSATYDRPEFQRALEPARQRLAAAIQDTGRGVVSAFVTSPTFGGGSVLAHLSLLSGVEVRDPDHYQLLMTQNRPTLVSVFRSAGYRAVAVMPGLRDSWPEGAFYGFDQIYGAGNLEYHGPGFGWWRIPDQFSLAALDVRELQHRPRQPLFVFFPTVSTHIPFEPVPPLQPDWQRMLTDQPFDADPLRRSLARTPDWTDLGKAYVSSVEYFLDTLTSYLRARPHDRFVLIILGDHQPAASVSGEGASWDVPVHVIASTPAVLEALQADGFRPGLAPARPAAGRMSELAPWALAAFAATAHAPPRHLPGSATGP